MSLLADALAAPYARLVREPEVHRAVLTSLVIATAAASLASALAWALVKAVRAARQAAPKRPGLGWFAVSLEAGGSLILVMPPMLVGAGWFILLLPWTDLFALAPLLVTVINALMAIPFATRILGPAAAEAAQRHDRLCASLGISGWNRFRRVDWPTLRRPMGLAFAFSMALSLGDLGAIALFGSEDVMTLPFLILQRMGSYRAADGAGLAAVLMALCLLLVWAAETMAARTRR
jgi:thiamine transport system permease protein